MPNEASKAAALLGRSGGRAGRGEAKRRGDSAYYSKLGMWKRKPKVTKPEPGHECGYCGSSLCHGTCQT